MSDIYLSITETPTVVTLTNPLISSNVAQSVTVTNVVSVNVVTMPAITVQAAAPAVTTVAGTVSISNFPSTQPIAGTVTANLVGWDGGNQENFRIGGYSVGAGNETRLALEVVGVDGNPLPISGTVTANGDYIGVVDTDTSAPPRGIAIGFLDANQSGNFVAVDNDNPDRHFPVKIGGSLPAISGTVTANLSNLASHASSITKADKQIQIIGGYSGGSPTNATAYPLGVESTGYINSNLRWGGTGVLVDTGASALPVQGTVTIGNSVTVSALPSGALTTRFGSVTTANTAQITSAVTNTSRKYLLAQNISAGTVTIGIGFSPTTTQGIQLTAGGGLTFDAFCPTGAVYWMGAVTGAAFTILEG